MIIALEGIDGSGKSTLFSMLKASGVPFWAISRSSRVKTYDELIELLLWILATPVNQLIVLDRHPLISETVYGPLLRGENLADDLPEDLYKASYSRVGKIIYCRPSKVTIRKNIQSTPQLAGVEENLDRILKAYDNLIFRVNVPVVIWDYEHPEYNPADLLK